MMMSLQYDEVIRLGHRQTKRKL